MNKHRSDIYGDITKTPTDNPVIPAATVVLLRDSSANGMEVLMLQKNNDISFGGMWVFPGGRIDAEDYTTENTSLASAAKVAAVRETEEETGIRLDAAGFESFAHWTPPPTTPKRFATWFFVAEVSENEAVEVDGQEITNHRWVSPEGALALHTEGKIDLAPPTWISLFHINQYQSPNAVLSDFRDQQDKIYETHIVKNKAGIRIALWAGDAGYALNDADVEGERHRLVLDQSGFVFENTVEEYG